MATKPKKEVLCDYCGSNNEAKHIYSAQKSFVSRKVLELLEIITHKNVSTFPQKGANLSTNMILISPSVLAAQ